MFYLLIGGYIVLGLIALWLVIYLDDGNYDPNRDLESTAIIIAFWPIVILFFLIEKIALSASEKGKAKYEHKKRKDAAKEELGL